MFSKETYAARRRQLRESVKSGGLILLPGNSDAPSNYPNNIFHFRQDSTFLYFFGINLPDMVGVLDVDSGEEVLFADDLSMDDIIWTGPQPTVGELGARVGIGTTRPLGDVFAVVENAVRRGRKVHFLPPYRADKKIRIAQWLGLDVAAVPNYISIELALAVVSLRDKKSDEEIARIEEACEIGYKMHTTAMKMCRPGVVEREIAGAIEGVALQYGAGVSFTSIVSQNGETLHNHYYGNTLEEGRLLLVDAGAEAVSNYCSDFTRTMPVSGRFTQRQKDVYNIVLAANARAFELSEPGKLYRDIHLESARVIARGLTDLGIMKGNPDDAVAEGAFALFMPHGLGHMMGLDVHDMEDIGEKYVGYDLETERGTDIATSALRMGRRLQPGMVMTVEPGIYFIPAYVQKWKAEGKCKDFIDFGAAEKYFGFGGIRIEDDLLITEKGNRMLGKKRIPVTVEEIEEFMGR